MPTHPPSEEVAIRALTGAQSRRAIEDHKALLDPAAEDPRVLEITVRDPREAAELRALLELALPKLREQRSRTRALLELVLPSRESVLAKGPAAQTRRNADFQIAIAEEFGLWTATEVATQAGSGARNAYATANRWRSSGKIFGVTLGGIVVYPAFQFSDDGQPLPILARVLNRIGPLLEGWELASWLTTERAELDEMRPVDVWLYRPDEVLELAEWTASDLEAAKDSWLASRGGQDAGGVGTARGGHDPERGASAKGAATASRVGKRRRAKG